METNLTVYLLKTLTCKVKGLKVKMRIIKVRNELVTFAEKDNPAATLMSHGFFLALPTPAVIKDPLLLGVLNQEDLRDEEPETKIGVFWSARKVLLPHANSESLSDESVEHFLGKRNAKTDQLAPAGKVYLWKHNLSLIKNGIIKPLPHSFIFDSIVGHYFKEKEEEIHFQEFATQTIPGLGISSIGHDLPPNEEDLELAYVPIKAYPCGSFELVVAIMRYLVQVHQDTLGTLKTPSVIVPEPETQAESQPSESPKKAKRPKWHLDELLAAVESLLESLYFTLRNLKRLGPPKEQAGLEAYNKLLETTQNDLYHLASGLLEFFFQPFSEALAECSLRGIIDPEKMAPTDCETFTANKSLLKKLVRISNLQLSKQSEAELELDFRIEFSLSDDYFLSIVSDSLDQHEFRRNFFRRVHQAIQGYPPNSELTTQTLEQLIGKAQSVSESVYRLKECYITQEFSKFGDMFISKIHRSHTCTIKSAKSDHSLNFSPIPDKIRDIKLTAVATWQKTTVFVLTEKIELEKLLEKGEGWTTIPDTITHVKVFQEEKEVASYTLEATFIMGKDEYLHRLIPYFTGRYYIKFAHSYTLFGSELAVLDLGPCFQATPERPRLHLNKMSDLMDQLEQSALEFATTDEFLSILVSDSNHVDKTKERTLKPTAITLIKFAGPLGLVAMDPIPCGHVFDEINHFSENYNVYQNIFAVNSICWSNNRQHLFYTNWSYGKQSTQTNSLLVGCFRVAKSLDSIKTQAFSSFRLNHLLSGELLSQARPRFRTLTLRSALYLVLDIAKEPGWSLEDCRPSQTLLARALFRAHNGKLHWVPVNNQLLLPMPDHIGVQIRYPGYETSHLPLFHHRRVFSTHQVVCSLHRLQYTPL